MLTGSHVPLAAVPVAAAGLSSVDDVNVFELRPQTLQGLVRARATAEVKKWLEEAERARHPMATRVTISLSETAVTFRSIIPCYLPAFVVPAEYNGRTYTIFVCGVNGVVGGPWFPNPETIGRTSAVGVALICLAALHPPPVGLLWGSVLGAAAYYVGFYGGRAFPSWMSAYRRYAREKRRKDSGDGSSGSRAGAAGQQQGPDVGKDGGSSEEATSSRDRERHDQRRQESRERRPPPPDGRTGSSSGSTKESGDALPADVKGFYRLLDLRGDESLEKVKAGFRRKALQLHPDLVNVAAATATHADDGKPLNSTAASSPADSMSRVNEAYAVLRNPKLREEYDRLR